MKLNEIIDFRHDKIDMSSIKRGERMGSGFYSTVYADNDDPHMVIKDMERHGGDKPRDGFSSYIEAIIENGMNGVNPYVPRVYKLNSSKTKDNEYKHTYQIEKLNDLEHLDKKDFEFIFSKLLSEDKIKEYTDHSVRLAWALASYIDDLVHGYEPLSKSKKLNEVIELIRQLYQRGLSYDIKPENMMYRSTPYGAQLVISDPLY
jgi:hypothetical protein